MSIDIRPAGSDDAESLATFNIRMAAETEDLVLNPTIVGLGVKRLLQNPALGHYTLAWDGDQLAGSAMITHEWSDWRNGQIWWIQSVYVPPEHRRKGVFSALYQHLENQARQDPDICGMRLYVERDNTNAQATYQALGMTETHYRLYEQMFD